MLRRFPRAAISRHHGLHAFEQERRVLSRAQHGRLDVSEAEAAASAGPRPEDPRGGPCRAVSQPRVVASLLGVLRLPDTSLQLWPLLSRSGVSCVSVSVSQFPSSCQDACRCTQARLTPVRPPFTVITPTETPGPEEATFAGAGS